LKFVNSRVYKSMRGFSAVYLLHDDAFRKYRLVFLQPDLRLEKHSHDPVPSDHEGIKGGFDLRNVIPS
jgi:hypothetical protein